MTKYDKELQSGTDEYEEAMHPLPAEPDNARESGERKRTTQDEPEERIAPPSPS